MINSSEIFGSMNGFPIYEDKYLGSEFVQVKFPRSKKRRIRKKWTKNRRNWAMRKTKDECYRIESPTGPVLIMSSSAYAKVKETVI